MVLWTGVFLAFANYSIEAGKHEEPPFENIFLGVALLIVILTTGLLSFFQESRSASLAKQFRTLVPQVQNNLFLLLWLVHSELVLF